MMPPLLHLISYQTSLLSEKEVAASTLNVSQYCIVLFKNQHSAVEKNRRILKSGVDLVLFAAAVCQTLIKQTWQAPILSCVSAVQQVEAMLRHRQHRHHKEMKGSVLVAVVVVAEAHLRTC